MKSSRVMGGVVITVAMDMVGAQVRVNAEAPTRARAITVRRTRVMAQVRFVLAW